MAVPEKSPWNEDPLFLAQRSTKATTLRHKLEYTRVLLSDLARIWKPWQ